MANAFRFRLARVQRIRELHEEMARAEFSAALGAARQAGEYVDFLRQEVAAARVSLAQLQNQATIDPRSMLAKDKSVQSILAALGPAKAQHFQLQQVAEVERTKWMEKKAAAQALEKLEKRHKERHFEEVRQKENEEQDEVAIARAFAKTKLENLTQKSGKGVSSPFRDFGIAPDSGHRGRFSAHSPL